jgi:hypothetical protein
MEEVALKKEKGVSIMITPFSVYKIDYPHSMPHKIFRKIQI